MNKRKLPEWLTCKEFRVWQPTSLYQQAWIRACETGAIRNVDFLYYRKCFPEFEVEYTTSFCIQPNCTLVFEPHSHITTNYNHLFYKQTAAYYFDTVSIPVYISYVYPRHTSCKRRLFRT